MGHPEHDMSAALLALMPGASVAIKGPFGTFRFQPGKYKAIGELFTRQATPSPCLLAGKVLSMLAVAQGGWPWRVLLEWRVRGQL